jgi:hypothetical protein
MTLTSTRRRAHASADRGWAGPTRSYDLVKEFVAALVAVTLLTVVLSAVFGSPDEKQITIANWANVDANGFVATAVQELDGTSGTATYGAPYNKTPAAQKIGPINLQDIGGVTVPVNTQRDFVLRPLSGVTGDAELSGALATYRAASPDQQQKWGTAYEAAQGGDAPKDPATVTAGDYGPVPVLATKLLRLAQAGGLDGALLAQGSFYQTDYTKPLLFLADGAYLEDQARIQHLGGDQWGMMNETGNYPGQAWLWLYTFWYQVSPFSTSDNADALVWGLMMLLTLAFVMVPFIPGLRSLPRHLGVHKLIWRDYYRSRTT